MCDDRKPVPIQLCDGQRPPRRPVNVPPPGERSADRTGFVVVRLASGGDLEARTLRDLAKRRKLGGLTQVLERHHLDSQPLIRSIKPETLLELERQARQSDFPPLRSLTVYWHVDARGADIDQVIAELSRLPEIELVYPELAPSDPVNPADDTYAGSQHHLDAAPTGIDARWAWTTGMAGADGAGVHFMDMERGWFLAHEDLPSPTLIHGDNKNGHDGYKGDHGTAVLGEIAGVDNTRGIIGIAPNLSSVRVSSYYDAATDTENHIAEAILAAATASPRPDVLLLEIQIGALLLPAETDPASFDAIRLAVANGITVVEAGGNGSNDLDAWTDGSGHHRLERSSADFRDSGAILIGAAHSALPHDRADFSNFGSRVDCYGWGENIVSAGYGDLATGGTDDTTYTQVFGGTSGASPIVSGAALLTQAIYRASSGTHLSPAQLRGLLSDPANGTPQGGGVAGHIGVMPDLKKIVQTGLGLVPDVYLRDAVGDNGNVPSTGAISISPDVIATTTAAADPQAAYGEGSGTENVDTLGDQVEHGQDNFVYVRMRNRGAAPAAATRATVYWSEVSTLVTPDLWHLIGTTAPLDVPVGDTLQVAGPLTWHAADLPVSGDHACFVAILDQALDPAPPLPSAGGSFDFNAFQSFVRAWNNVSWRNFNVVDLMSDPNADPLALEFLIAGSPDAAHVFDLEIRQRLPRGVEVALEVPRELAAILPKEHFPKIDLPPEGRNARLALPFLRELPLCGVRLAAGARHRSRLLVRGGHDLPPGLYTIAIRQIYEGIEMGRVTWGLRVRPAKR